MQLAKLTAVRIWREGRQASDEYHCEACGHDGRVNLTMNTLFPCEECGNHVDLSEDENQPHSP